jgi:Myb-like DNA-binding domain
VVLLYCALLQQRWKRALRPDLKKGRWTAEEDGRLIRLMAQGFASWSKLAKQMPGRSSKQCRERWSNHLDPCKFSLSLAATLHAAAADAAAAAVNTHTRHHHGNTHAHQQLTLFYLSHLCTTKNIRC